jgi:hypothetical protein
MPTSHHDPFPPMADSIKRNHASTIVSMGVLQQILG